MQTLLDLIKPERLTAVVDIGANPVEGQPPYRSMLEMGLCSVVGFEPLVEALNALNAKKGPNETYLPYIVGDGGEHTLYLTRRPGMVSLLKPDMAHLEFFDSMPESGAVEATMATSTVRLDDLSEVPHCDLLKLDIQGAELSALENATRHLANAAMVITEVSMVTLYEQQPVMGTMDLALRAHGFVPHCFADATCWPIATEVRVPKIDPHQVLEIDLVYVRDFTKPMLSEHWKQLAMLAHHVCGSYDLAMLAVEMLSKDMAIPADAPVAYAKMLEQR